MVVCTLRHLVCDAGVRLTELLSRVRRNLENIISVMGLCAKLCESAALDLTLAPWPCITWPLDQGSASLSPLICDHGCVVKARAALDRIVTSWHRSRVDRPALSFWGHAYLARQTLKAMALPLTRKRHPYLSTLQTQVTFSMRPRHPRFPEPSFR